MKAWKVSYSTLRESGEITEIEELEMTVTAPDIMGALRRAEEQINRKTRGTDIKKTVIWDVGMIVGTDPEEVFE